MNQFKSNLIQWIFKSVLAALLLTSMISCTGSVLEEETLSSLSQSNKGGIELDEYIPPGIQFVEGTSQGMIQDGFPYLKNNRTFNIKWIIKTCDPVNDPTDPVCAAAGTAENPDPGFYITRLYYSSDNGANWYAIPGGSDLGGYNDQVQSFSWSIPISLTTEGDQFRFKLVTKNAQNSEFWATSSNFVMDNTPPTITPNSLKFNGSLDSPLSLQSRGVSIEFGATDNLSPISAFCLKEAAAPPAGDSSCWISLSSMGLTESLATQVSNIRRVLGWIGGSFTYYFWVKDKAGNMSVLTNQVCDQTIDCRTISYSPGRAVVFSKALASNTDNISENPKVEQTIINSTNPTLQIKWNFTLDPSTTLDPVQPYKIEYSTNGSTFTNLVDGTGVPMTDAQISSAVDTNCQTISSTEPNGIQKCFSWTVPSSLYGLPIYIRIHVRDGANFVYSISTNPLNLNASVDASNQGLGLRFVAGLSDGLVGASALSTKFNIDQGNQGGKLVVHEDGRVFVLDQTYGILVINPYDGKTQIYVKRTGSSIDGVAVDTPSLLLSGEKEGTTSGTLKISLDYRGRLLILENQRIRQVTDEYDSQGNLTGRRQVKTIVGCTTSPCFYDNVAKNNAYNTKVPKAYWPNAWIYANEFDYRPPNNGMNIQYRHFTPTPNGDIYFSVNAEPGYISTTVPSSSNGYRGLDFRIYRPDSDPTKPGKVYPLKLGGFGVLGEPFRPISDLYPSGVGGLSFNPQTGTPTVLTMFWELCPPSTVGQCDFFTSNHNPKTGASAGTGTHYYSVAQSLYAPAGIPRYYSGYFFAKYITSRRGELYAINNNYGPNSLSKLNTSTNKFVKILGGNYNGYCPDGTLATSCNTFIKDAWITQDNTVFFIDGIQIRMIGADGRVVTLFGRGTSDRNGADAMLTTLPYMEDFSKWTPSDGSPERLILKDFYNNLLREVTIQGNVDQIAGNSSSFWNLGWKASLSKAGYYVSTALALNDMGYWPGGRYIQPPAVVNPSNGEVFSITPDNLSIAKLIRADNASNPDHGRWFRLLGGGTGATPLFGTKGASSCDGKKSNECHNDWAGSTHLAGMIPEKQLTPDAFGNPRTRPAQAIMIINRATSVWEKYYLKLVDADTGVQTHLAGNDNQLSTYTNYFPDSFSPVAMTNSNQIPFAYQITSLVYDPTRDALITGMYGVNRIGLIELKTDPTTEMITGAGNYYNLTYTTYPVAAFTHNVQSGYDVIYYCSTNGHLYRRVLSSSPSEIALPLPPGMYCVGGSRNLEKTVDENLGIIKLYVPIGFNGQYMIGEYSVSLGL